MPTAIVKSVVTFSCLCASSFAVASDDAVDSSVFQKILEHRQLLRSGSFRAIGRIRWKFDDEEHILPRNLHCTFDKDAGCFFVQIEGETIADMRSSDTMTPEVAEQLRTKTFDAKPSVYATIGYFVRNRNYSAEWYGRQEQAGARKSSVNIVLLDAGQTASLAGFEIFDPDVAGLAETKHIRSRATIDDILKSLTSSKTTLKKVDTKEGKIKIRLERGKVVREVIVDAENGFTVQSMVLAEVDDEGQFRPLPQRRSSANWEEVNGVWVPVSLMASRFQKNGRHFIVEYDIDWADVNKSPGVVEEKAYSYERFEQTWDGITVVDKRGEETRLIGVFSGGTVESPERKGEGPDINDGGHVSPIRYLVGINVVVLLLILILIAYKRQRRRVT